ncbi:unnamed protein product [Phytophthora fragariaefolia]|uniref:Unnamed protein product n=1 Tax=Phytophthora fragariaefolia TaxID=1490495 RepID=A0A9W6Y6D8_9STRA|nr:unnamed protein product [Phytophthora fragariaefolia]
MAFQATTDQGLEEELHSEPDRPLVDRPLYETPLKILRRDAEDAKPIVAQVSVAHPDEAKPEPRSEQVGRAGGSDRPIASDSVSEASEDIYEVRSDHDETASQLNTPPIATQDDIGDEEVCYHEGGDLFAEDVQKRLRSCRNSSCDAASTADRSTIPREAIGPDQEFVVGEDDHSIHISVGVPDRDHHQENGVDIRLCIDFRLVNSLTRLMVYPMPMINDLLEDLDKVLWYCALDMASGFWVVSMTKRARKISAFITSFGLFEWTRMPFGLKNAPLIYQRLIDNAMYGHLRISADQDRSNPVDVFEAAEPEPNPKPSVLGSRSYIDDILVTATTWDSMCEKVERLIDACERWNLSISVVKSVWGQRRVGCLGHQADRWTRAKVAFTMLNVKLVSTPILKHFDPDRTSVIMLYASQLAISAALVQEYGGVYWPETSTSRTLKSNELNYGIVDKGVLALLCMLEVNYTLLTTRSVVVQTRHSTLAWLVNSTGFQGRLGNWAALLSEWSLEIRKCSMGDEFLGVIAASINPRAEVDEALIAIAPVKEPRQTIALPSPTVEEDERLLVVSFDGAARTKRSSGAYSANIWRLPEWTIVTAASGYSPDLTVNEVEYRGLLLCLDLLAIWTGADRDLRRPQPGHPPNARRDRVQGHRAAITEEKALDRLSSWPNHDFLHMKREWIQSADKLASAELQQEEGVEVTSEDDKQDLITLNRLDELQKLRNNSGRIIQAQDEEKWIGYLKAYVQGEVARLSAEDTKCCANIDGDYDFDESGLLLYCAI